MITHAQLVSALATRGAASEWVVVSREREVARLRRGVAPLDRLDDDRVLSGLVHRDTTTGRGSARITLVGDVRSPDSIVDDALARAAAAVGPAWRMAPAAASARVSVADPVVERGSVAAAAGVVVTRVKSAAGAAAVSWRQSLVEVVREVVTISTSQGIEQWWRATEVTARVIITVASASREVVVTARRLDDLDLVRVLTESQQRLVALASAEPTPRGSWPIVMSADVLLTGGMGLLAAFAAQADPMVDRQGLGRYRPGQPVAPGAAAIAEPLSITSDGTVDFAPRSAPMADGGEPVRRFTLVDRGICSGLGLDHREAAVRRILPNGGVRNLVVTGGTSTADELRASPALEIHELAWLDLDPRTGEASAAIGLATLHDERRSRSVRGGVIHLDAIAALGLATRSASVVRRGPYVGPDHWRLPAAVVS